jgi:hypothetical protein
LHQLFALLSCQPAGASGILRGEEKHMRKLLVWLTLTTLVFLAACGDATPAVELSLPKKVGDLELPQPVARVEINPDELRTLTALSGKLEGIEYGAYVTSKKDAELFQFYRTNLTSKGWQAQNSGNNPHAALFSKDSRTTLVVAFNFANQEAINGLVQTVPSLKDKIKPGDSLLVLVQGPQQAFESGTSV